MYYTLNVDGEGRLALAQVTREEICGATTASDLIDLTPPDWPPPRTGRNALETEAASLVLEAIKKETENAPGGALERFWNPAHDKPAIAVLGEELVKIMDGFDATDSDVAVSVRELHQLALRLAALRLYHRVFAKKFRVAEGTRTDGSKYREIQTDDFTGRGVLEALQKAGHFERFEVRR